MHPTDPRSRFSACQVRTVEGALHRLVLVTCTVCVPAPLSTIFRLVGSAKGVNGLRE